MLQKYGENSKVAFSFSSNVFADVSVYSPLVSKYISLFQTRDFDGINSWIFRTLKQIR